MPFARRELYRESSAAPFELLRVPVISLCGAAFVVFSLFLVGRFVVDERLALGGGRVWLLVSVPFVIAASWGAIETHRRLQRRRRELRIEITVRRPEA
jgi:hypothetical protein